MLSDLCFSNGLCVQVRAPTPKVQPSPGSEVYSNVGFLAAENPTTTVPGHMSGDGAALVGFLAMCTGVARRRSNKSRKQSSALQAFGAGVLGSSAPSFDYCLDGEGSIKKQIKIKHGPDDALSLSKFMSRPLSEFALVPLPAGVTMKLKGEEVSSFTGKKEFLSDLNLPPIDFPGFFSINCTAGAYTSRQPNGSVVIQGDQLAVKASGAADVGDPAKSVKFYNRTEVKFVDTPSKHEIEITAEVSMKWDPPGPLRMVLPKMMFTPVGDAAMKKILDLVLNAFANSFEQEYHRWAANEAYRADCTRRGATLEASLKK